MDGKPLYEYARQGIPLPRPIEGRKVTVHSLEIVKWLGCDHAFRWPEKQLSSEEKQALETALKSVREGTSINDEPEMASNNQTPTAFVLKMKVSGGTYVRSIVHDLAHSLGSAGHVVTLKRTRQGRFVLDPVEEDDQECVPWEFFEKALSDVGERDEDGWTEWEKRIIRCLDNIL